MVVLGSGSGEARYVDARNLFRWAWLLPGIVGEEMTAAERGEAAMFWSPVGGC